MGHITYDGQPLNMDLLKEDLLRVNPNFKFYTNELSSCDILKEKDAIIRMANGKPIYDDDMLSNLRYVWSSPEKTYRGILYCLPDDVNIKGLRKI